MNAALCRAAARSDQPGPQLPVHGRRLQSGEAGQLEQSLGPWPQAGLGHCAP